MKYRVRANMSVVLEVDIEAASMDEALTLAKEIANSGLMPEVACSEEISGWEATQVAP
jgi:hypothetical protein